MQLTHKQIIWLIVAGILGVVVVAMVLSPDHSDTPDGSAQYALSEPSEQPADIKTFSLELSSNDLQFLGNKVEDSSWCKVDLISNGQKEPVSIRQNRRAERSFQLRMGGRVYDLYRLDEQRLLKHALWAGMRQVGFKGGEAEIVLLKLNGVLSGAYIFEEHVYELVRDSQGCFFTTLERNTLSLRKLFHCVETNRAALATERFDVNRTVCSLKLSKLFGYEADSFIRSVLFEFDSRTERLSPYITFGALLGIERDNECSKAIGCETAKARKDDTENRYDKLAQMLSEVPPNQSSEKLTSLDADQLLETAKETLTKHAGLISQADALLANSKQRELAFNRYLDLLSRNCDGDGQYYGTKIGLAGLALPDESPQRDDISDSRPDDPAGRMAAYADEIYELILSKAAGRHIGVIGNTLIFLGRGERVLLRYTVQYRRVNRYIERFLAGSDKIEPKLSEFLWIDARETQSFKDPKICRSYIEGQGWRIIHTKDDCVFLAHNPAYKEIHEQLSGIFRGSEQQLHVIGNSPAVHKVLENIAGEDEVTLAYQRDKGFLNSVLSGNKECPADALLYVSCREDGNLLGRHAQVIADSFEVLFECRDFVLIGKAKDQAKALVTTGTD